MSDLTNPAETTRPAYVLDEQVGFILRLVGQRHSAIFQRLAPEGLTTTQFAAFVRLAELGECSQNELGRRTAMDVATIKGVVDRLRRKGMVTLRDDPHDKRRALLSVAPDYAHLTDDLYSVGLRISAETLEPLNRDEQRTLLRLLKKLR
ncbi:MAG: MarR family transcriptional regulator [Silicimonas sp.]|nr:MarR family transcriptional regulator [Silicimonas sp.]